MFYYQKMMTCLPGTRKHNITLHGMVLVSMTFTSQNRLFYLMITKAHITSSHAGLTTHLPLISVFRSHVLKVSDQAAQDFQHVTPLTSVTLIH